MNKVFVFEFVGLDNNFFNPKDVNIFKELVLTQVLGAQKNHLIETSLLSTHNICFGCKIRKLFLGTLSLLKSCGTH